ncbi:hypothetical protein RIF29_19376 [Crotalaria pallida]|uniref:Clp R domain-containing protein n=1 Tax=Crotalaria pallida TaxID=3830 RepID=A0AAN9I7P0_CROPI
MIVGLSLPHSIPVYCNRNDSRLSPFHSSLTFPTKPTSLRILDTTPFNKREAFANGFQRTTRGRNPKQFSVRSALEASSSGKITQQEFTKVAWQAIVSSPEVAKENKHQIVETEHMMKALLEQKNGLACQIFSKVGVDNT